MLDITGTSHDLVRQYAVKRRPNLIPPSGGIRDGSYDPTEQLKKEKDAVERVLGELLANVDNGDFDDDETSVKEDALNGNSPLAILMLKEVVLKHTELIERVTDQEIEWRQNLRN